MTTSVPGLTPGYAKTGPVPTHQVSHHQSLVNKMSDALGAPQNCVKPPKSCRYHPQATIVIMSGARIMTGDRIRLFGIIHDKRERRMWSTGDCPIHLRAGSRLIHRPHMSPHPGPVSNTSSIQNCRGGNLVKVCRLSRIKVGYYPAKVVCIRAAAQAEMLKRYLIPFLIPYSTLVPPIQSKNNASNKGKMSWGAKIATTHGE